MCYGLGFAPEVLAYQPLPGGWHVVVMEFLLGHETLVARQREGRIPVEVVNAVEEAVGKMHDGGYVHGDLRLPNILVGPGNSVKFVDFDWAGLKGEAVYPPLMNPDVGWHPDARLGKEILPEHDLYLLRSELIQVDQ